MNVALPTQQPPKTAILYTLEDIFFACACVRSLVLLVLLLLYFFFSMVKKAKQEFRIETNSKYNLFQIHSLMLTSVLNFRYTLMNAYQIINFTDVCIDLIILIALFPLEELEELAPFALLFGWFVFRLRLRGVT